jgi:PTH1 family peptidyl-tRNA hydrolase
VPKAVVGLGNPGARYARTRHNVGFMVVDRFRGVRGGSPQSDRHASSWAEVRVGDAAVVLVEPQTYMNRSGVAVAAFVAELALEPADVLVVHDELDLPFARIKLKRGGGTAGHRGLESIVEHLGTRDFPRLRVGIGRPAPGQEIVDFVLQPFTAAETGSLDTVLEAAATAVEAWCTLGIEAAMGQVNAPPPAPADAPGA